MFTGLVQALGTVERREEDGQGGAYLAVREPTLAAAATVGDSIAVNGACLTVVMRTATAMEFQAGPETLARTNLGRLAVGDPVNLEPSLRVGDALGGHFVTGHVDCLGHIAVRLVSGEWQTVWFEFPIEFEDLLVPKGSVAVDGVSLTVVDVRPGQFSVMLIPHTLANTTLGAKPVGGVVNLEFDLLAKHVRKLIRNYSPSR